MNTPEFSSYGRTGPFEGPCKDVDPREVTAEGSRQISDSLWQPSAYGDKISRLEASYQDIEKRLVQLEKEISNNRAWSDTVDTRLQSLEGCRWQYAASNQYEMQETSNPDPPDQEGHRSYEEAFHEGITQKELQGKEEYKKLKEKNKELEARNKGLLSKVMGMHKHSENMNDPSRLSAVLHMYEMLRLRDWERLRSSTVSCLTYKSGSSIIKKLFDACEKDIEKRTNNITEVLEISPLNDAMINSQQEMVQQIRNLFRYSYSQNHSEFYSKIVMQAGVDPKTTFQNQFVLNCCKMYCLLLLQDPPVTAVWNLQESPRQYLEHVDKKGQEHWRKPAFLWPIMKCGEQVIVKGVVWDEK
ncbi:uncharacterized protein LOC142050256 [Phalacrocorax aristotelis]|uniref:uncharacterized protein LOC142050256 n=1 Tax=Phalacrocorax aristotelis TaxID=126867 RepID=UPI003F4B4203